MKTSRRAHSPPEGTSNSDVSITDDLREYAQSIGCDAVGVTTAAPLAGAAEYAVDRVERGLLAGLDWYTSERARASAEPARLMADARAVVSVAVSYLGDEDEEPAPGLGPRGVVARCARGADYHRVVRDRLRAIGDWLRVRLGDDVAVRRCVDKDWLAERAVALRAGLGTLGKNATLITPTHGSWVFLGEVVTSAPLEAVEAPAAADRFSACGDCRRCIAACPTGALVGPGEVDSRRCLSFLTIEWSGWLPRDLRPALGRVVYGCDRCQEVCPRNDGARPGNHSEFGPERGVGSTLPLADLLDVTGAESLASRFDGTPLARAALRGLRRNAAVVLGNVGDREATPLLIAALGDADPLVRGHAAWALGLLGGKAARRALATARRAEVDPRTLEEIDLALSSI